MNSLISLLVAFSIISLPLYLVRFSVLNIPTTLHEILVWITFILVLSVTGVRNKLSSVDKILWLGILLIIVGAILGVYVSADKVATLGLVKGYIITPIILGLIMLIAPVKNKIIINSLFLSGLIVAASVYIDIFINKIALSGRAGGIYNLDTGASPNYVSLFLTPLAGIILAKIIADIFQNKWQNVWRKIAVFILIFGAVIASQSRAGIFIILLIGLSTVYSNITKRVRQKKVVNRLAIAVIVILAASVIKIASPNLSATPDSGRISSSNNIRYEIWKTTFKDIIPSYWLTGVGIGQYQNIFTYLTQNRVNYPEYIAPKALTPHNVLLSAWMNIGLVGLIGLILVIISIYRNRYLFHIESNHIFTPYSLLLTAILLLGIFDTSVFKNDLGGLFWIAIFMLSSEKGKLS